jgi:hypothetical protein
MECFQEREKFLYKYKDHLDFVLLTHNKSVTENLIKKTKDLPWHVDKNFNKLPIPDDYYENKSILHTSEDKNNWKYIEALYNPFWTWENFVDILDIQMKDLRWNERYGRWFFTNWSRNKVIMKTSTQKVIDSLRAYVAATKIKRSFKKCITNPNYQVCKKRLHREFHSLSDINSNT